MPAPIAAAALVAARLAAKQAAKKVAKKAVKTTTKKAVKSAKTAAQKANTDKIAKSSVRVKPANKSNPTNERLNQSTNFELKRMKSGDAAKAKMRLEEKRNEISQAFFGKPKTVKINSSIKSTKAVKKTSPKKK